jgi:hypothetical protein
VPPFAVAKPAPAKEKRVEPQTIKVEVGEEVHAERRKAYRNAVLLSLLTLGLGVGLGWVVGGQKVRADFSKLAVKGAVDLEPSVAAAQTTLEKIRDLTKGAYDTFAEGKYPVEFIKEAQNINVEFDATKIEGKRVADLPPKTQKMIYKFLVNVEDLNKTKDKLRGLLVTAQAPVEKYWKDSKEPQAAYSVVFTQGQRGPIAELVPNKEPILWSVKEFPAEWEFKKTEGQGQQAKEVDKKGAKWSGKGDFWNAEKPIVFPVDPKSVAKFSGETLVFQVRKNLADLRQVLEGSQEDPQNPTKGLVEDAKDLDDQLRKDATATGGR